MPRLVRARNLAFILPGKWRQNAIMDENDFEGTLVLEMLPWGRVSKHPEGEARANPGQRICRIIEPVLLRFRSDVW